MYVVYFFEFLLPKKAFATLSHMAKQSQQLVLMLVIGILIGTAGVMAWKTRTVGTDESDTNITTDNGAMTATDTLANAQETMKRTEPSLPLAPSIPSGSRLGLRVEDQPAGDRVSVSGFEVKESNWIAVYDDRDGQPGWIIGAARVFAGDTQINVELLRSTIKGQKYYVGILSDDGDKTFSRQTDLPPLSPDKVVIVSFVAE